MPINVLQKKFPRGKGPDPFYDPQQWEQKKSETELTSKEEDLAAKEAQDLWESQETGLTRWSGEGDTRYSDPN